MTEYYISGTWKDDNNVITHYAFHQVKNTIPYNIVKKSKFQAVQLLSKSTNSAQTIVWDYIKATWRIGETVIVVGGKYLRSNPDDTKTDNLAHLIDFGLIKLQ